MAGPRDKSDNDAVSSFFDDDDDWLDDDEDEDEEEEEQEEAPPVEEPVAEVPAPPAPEPEPVFEAPPPEPEPEPIAAAEEPVEVPAPVAVSPPPLAVPPPPALPPPPPPPFLGDARTLATSGQGGLVVPPAPRGVDVEAPPPEPAIEDPAVDAAPEVEDVPAEEPQVEPEAAGPESEAAAPESEAAAPEPEATPILEPPVHEEAPPVLPERVLVVPPTSEGWKGLAERLGEHASTLTGEAAEAAWYDAAHAWFWRAGDPATALACLEHAALRDPRCVALRVRAAEQLGQSTVAAAGWAALAEVTESVPAAWARRNQAHVLVSSLDDPGAAREALEQATVADPGDLDAWQSRIAMAASPSDRAAYLLELAALVDEPLRASIHGDRADSLLAAGETVESAAAAQEAWRHAPTSGERYLRAEQAWKHADNPTKLAEFYAEVAQHETGGPLHRVLEGRAWRAAGEDDKASAAWQLAIDDGLEATRSELNAAYAATGRHDALAASLAASLADNAGDGRDWYRVGTLREFRLGDGQGALLAYRQAGQAGFSPGAEAAQRLASAFGDPEELVGELRTHLEASPSDERARFALAETLERTGAHAEAVAAWRGVLELIPDDRLAMLGLARAARASGDAAAAADASRELAQVTATPDRRSARLLGAAVPVALIPTDPVALSALAEAVDADPTNIVAVELLVDGLIEAGRVDDAVTYLAAARDAAEIDVEAAVLGYRLATVRAWRAGDGAGASAALQQVLERDPDMRAAGWLLDSVGVGSRGTELLAARRNREGVDQEAAAALLADALGETADGTTSLAERLGAMDAAVPGRSLLLAECLASTDRDAALDALGAPEEGTVSWTHARLAEAMGAPDRAVAFLGETAPLERARLLALTGAEPDAVAALRTSALDDEGLKVAAAFELARVASGEDVAAANELLADAVSSPALKARYLSRAAASLVAAEKHADASDLYGRAAEHRADPGLIENALAQAEAAADAERIELLYTSHRADDARGLADALERLSIEAGVEARTAALDGGGLYDRMAFEQSLRDRGEWRQLFDALSERGDASETEAARVEVERRSVLAEHLAETDEAYELYQKLHEASPDDAGIIENLARISGARGDTDAAVSHLKRLVDSAASAEDAARYQRRIAEAHRTAGDTDAARQALLDALDHSPNDLDALRDLQAIAEDSGDWQALLGVRKREAAIATGERRVEVLRDVARLTEEKVEDHDIAVDAWRKVVDEVPGDREALDHLLQIARTQKDHELFLETAGAIEGVLSGGERSTLLREMGELSEGLDRREDAIHFFEQAVAAEEPDAVAAERLEALYRESGDWVGVVRSLVGRSQSAPEPEQQVSHLLEAARVERDFRHDREAAARLYEQVLRIDETQTDALRFLVTYLYEAARYDEALPIASTLEPAIQEGLDLDDFDARMDISSFFFRFAEMLRGALREDEAVARYERALEFNPAHLPTLEAVGPLYVAASSWDKVGEVYRQVLQLTGGQGDPQRVANTYTMLGHVDREHNKMERAHKRFNKALEVFPNFVPALKGLAAVLAHNGEWNTLLTIYNSIIYHATVPADVVDAYMTKGRVLDEKLQRPDKAIQHYDRSIAFDRRQPEAYLRRAELAMRRNNWEEAQDFARRGIEVASGPERAPLDFALAAARVALDDMDGGSAALAQGREADADVVDTLGDIADPAAAASSLREWLKS